MLTSRPRLLIVSATYVARENRKKLAALAAHFEVTAVTCRRNRSSLLLEERADDEEAIASQNRTAPPYHLISRPALGRPTSTTKYVLLGLGRLLRQERAFDVILVEAEPWALVRWQTWFWAKFWQRRARFGEFSWENVERSGWRGQVLPTIYRAAIANDDFVIAGSSEAAAIFRRRGMEGKRLLNSPQLGVDADLFRPLENTSSQLADLRRSQGLPPDGFFVGYAGRLTTAKGVLDLLAAVEEIQSASDGMPIRLVLLGTGELESQLRELAKSKSWLHLLPPRPHAEVAAFLQILDAFVLPSRGETTGSAIWQEQFGHVLIEAMACEVTTLGSAHGAIPEVLGDDPEALFPVGDRAALAARLRRWHGEPAHAAALARRQRARVLDHFTHEKLAEIWTNFLLRQLAD